MRARVAVALVMALATAAWAADTGSVQGTVQEQGSPAAGLKVVIESAADSRYSASAATDAAGAFAFTEVPVGEVEVKVYDAEDRLKVSGKGLIEAPGQSITVLLHVGS